MNTMTARDVAERASKFADSLIAELEEINRKYPKAILEEQEAKILSQSEMPLLSPKDFRAEFEAAFCCHIAAHCIIVP